MTGPHDVSQARAPGLPTSVGWVVRFGGGLGGCGVFRKDSGGLTCVGTFFETFMLDYEVSIGDML